MCLTSCVRHGVSLLRPVGGRGMNVGTMRSTRVGLILGMVTWLCALGRVSADAAASMDALASVPAGATLEVRWAGPNALSDKIAVAPAGAPAATLLSFVYTMAGNPARLLAPQQPGDYELRYLRATTPEVVLTRRSVKVSPVMASVTSPGRVASGAFLSLDWTGPNNQMDRIAVVPAGAPEGVVTLSARTGSGHPARLFAPQSPGEYEVRYVTGYYNITLAAAKLTVYGPALDAIEAPSTVVVGSSFDVVWRGPARPYDLVVLAHVGASDQSWDAACYVAPGRRITLRAPLDAGQYELRYLRGVLHRVLARAALTTTAVTPLSNAVTAAPTPPREKGPVELPLQVVRSTPQKPHRLPPGK